MGTSIRRCCGVRENLWSVRRRGHPHLVDRLRRTLGPGITPAIPGPVSVDRYRSRHVLVGVAGGAGGGLVDRQASARVCRSGGEGQLGPSSSGRPRALGSHARGGPRPAPRRSRASLRQAQAERPFRGRAGRCHGDGQGPLVGRDGGPHAFHSARVHPLAAPNWPPVVRPARRRPLPSTDSSGATAEIAGRGGGRADVVGGQRRARHPAAHVLARSRRRPAAIPGHHRGTGGGGVWSVHRRAGPAGRAAHLAGRPLQGEQDP